MALLAHLFWSHSGCLVVPKVAFNTEGRLQRGLRPPKSSEGRSLVPVYQGLSLVTERNGQFEPVLLGSQMESKGDDISWIGMAHESSALAELQRRASHRVDSGFWMLDFSAHSEAPSMSELGLHDAQWCKLRSRHAGPSVCDRLASDDYAALLAIAAGLSEWHRSVRFCSKCGGETKAVRAGSNRQCLKCESRFRPRVDPAMLVLVTDGDRCLLGRKASWPPGRFSALAGFVEFGETLEECVVREVREESGVIVDKTSITFCASQPWLFPRSLLLGFTARAAKTEIEVTDELEDVKWFEAGYVEACLADKGKASEDFNIPSETSLAHSLIKGWLNNLHLKT